MLGLLTLKMHPHLERLLITYECKGKFHFLYPHAQGNLRGYWKRQAQPMETNTYLWAIQQIYGLASALNQIHNFSIKPPPTKDTLNSSEVMPETTHERPPMNVRLRVDQAEAKFGRHDDLKAENIHWFNNLEDDPEDDPLGILQIADFGLGRFHRLS